MSGERTKYTEQAILNFSVDDTVSPPRLVVGMASWNGSSWVAVDNYKRAAATSTNVSVGASSTPVLAINASRASAILSNDSDSVIYVTLGATAVLNQGIRLNAYGGAITIESYTGAISAISSGASKNLCVVEI